jgi:hypothetical protein
LVTRLGQPSIQASARRTRLLSAFSGFSGSVVQVCGTTEALEGLMPLNSSSPIAFLAQADLNGRAGHFSAIGGFSGSAVQMNGTAETLNELTPLINSAHRLVDRRTRTRRLASSAHSAVSVGQRFGRAGTTEPLGRLNTLRVRVTGP